MPALAEQLWSVTYTVPLDEDWRSNLQMYDADGNIYEVAREYSEGMMRYTMAQSLPTAVTHSHCPLSPAANNIAFRKFDGANGKQIFNKKLTPCPGFSPYVARRCIPLRPHVSRKPIHAS
jgi:hypothetical protein